MEALEALFVPFMSGVHTHVRVSLVQSQVPRPEQPGAEPTPTDKPFFLCMCVVFRLGLGLLPADNTMGHTYRINDWSALPYAPSFSILT